MKEIKIPELGNDLGDSLVRNIYDSCDEQIEERCAPELISQIWHEIVGPDRNNDTVVDIKYSFTLEDSD